MAVSAIITYYSSTLAPKATFALRLLTLQEKDR